MNRPFKNVKGLSDNMKGSLSNLGWKCRDVLIRNKLELMVTLKRPHEEIDLLTVLTSEFVTPLRNFQKGLEMLKNDRRRTNFLKTNHKELDEALQGGIPYGNITEIVGPSGVGKTQFCLSLAADFCQGFHGGVIFLDTELTFTSERLEQIVRTRMQSQQGFVSRDRIRSSLDGVKHVRVDSVESMIREVNALENSVADHDIGLVIVDSIAAPIRQRYQTEQFMERQDVLNTCASKLKHVAETYHIPVIVTNHITIGKQTLKQFFQGSDLYGNNSISSTPKSTVGLNTQMDRKKVKPALGNTWSHFVNTRLYIESKVDNQEQKKANFHFRMRDDGEESQDSQQPGEGERPKYGKCIVLKSPIAPQSQVEYMISNAGVTACKKIDDEMDRPNKRKKLL